MSIKKKRDFFPKKEVQERLDHLQNNGQRLHYEKVIPLTPQDILLIKSLFAKVAGFFTVLSFPVTIVMYNFKKDTTVLVICGVMLFFFLYAIVKAAILLGVNLRAGKKTMVRGIITDRFTKKEYSERDEDGKRGSADQCCLKIGDKEIAVNPLIYSQHKIGEAIELHFLITLKKKPYFLLNENLSDAGLTTAMPSPDE